MRGWEEVKVSDIGRIVTGNTPPRKSPELYGDDTIFIKPTDISEEQKCTYNPEECYSELGARRYKNSLIPKGSTCVVTIGSIGKKLTMAHCDCFINQAMNAVIPFKDYDREFVYYVLKYNLSQLKTLDSGTASGRENVSKSAFSSIKIKVPINKNVRKKIGKILSAYDDLIENNLKRIKLLEELAQRTYEEWFVKFRVNGEQLEVNDETGLPEGWERKPFPEVIDFLEGPGLRNSQYKEDGVPFLNIRVIKDNEVDFSKVQYLDLDEVNSRYSHFLLEENDHVISTSGTLGRIVTIRKSHLPLCMNTSLIRMRQKNCSFGKWLIKHVISNYRFKNIMESFANGSAQLNFGPIHLRQIKVLVPPLDIALEYEKLVEPIEELIKILKDFGLLLKESRDILLPRLMNGTIDVEAAEEEVYSMVAEDEEEYKTEKKENERKSNIY